MIRRLRRPFIRLLDGFFRLFEDSPAKRARKIDKRIAKLERERQREAERHAAEDAAFEAKQSETSSGLLDHLSDLRKALVRAALAVALFSTIALIFAEQILIFLLEPYGDLLQVTNPTESVSIFIRVGLSIGVAVASPFILLEILRFFAPALRPREARTVWLVVPAAFILFLSGASFAWFVMLPAAINFLSSFMPNIFAVDWKADEYIPFVLQLTLWIGIAFEMPLLAMALAAFGMVTPGMLARNWRFAVVGAAILAALITPTVDPFNMLLVMGPLLVLYGISILLTFIPYRRRKRRAEYELLLEERAKLRREMQRQGQTQ